MLILFAAQAAALPDIHVNAVVDARSVTIEKQGDARLEVRAEPDAGSLVRVEAPRANGARTLSNVRVTLDAQARIGAGSPIAGEVEADAAASDATESGEAR